jgi:hypothetical protein
VSVIPATATEFEAVFPDEEVCRHYLIQVGVPRIPSSLSPQGGEKKRGSNTAQVSVKPI